MPAVNNRSSDRYVLCVTVSILLLFVICTTVYIALQSRQTVAQSQRMDEFETLAKRLSRRVDVLESMLAAQVSRSRLEGEGNKAGSGPSHKIHSSKEEKRSRRQFSSFCPCVQGPPGLQGPPGIQGLKGDKGEPGLKGLPGPQGLNGTSGLRGEKGDQGLAGSKGDRGLVGSKGDQGLIGVKGNMGPPGANGDIGPRGPPGPLISESIHLVGDGKRVIQPSVSQSISAWRVEQKQGNIQYRSEVAAIVISKPGSYYVYSQMYYHDLTTPIMGHYTCINGRKVMESIGAVIQKPHQKFDTKYHGGVFRLSNGDRIQIRVPSTKKMYYMGPATSILGAFWIGP